MYCQGKQTGSADVVSRRGQQPAPRSRIMAKERISHRGGSHHREGPWALTAAPSSALLAVQTGGLSKDVMTAVEQGALESPQHVPSLANSARTSRVI